MLLEQLRARLKLDAAADEQAVCAKVLTLLDKADADATALGTASARVTELETAQRTRDCDAFVAANKDVIADEVTIRARFMADPAAVTGMFKALKPAAAAPQTAARRIGSGAETPETAPAVGAAKKIDQAAVRKLASEIVRDTKCSKAQAICRAERTLRNKTEGTK
jgi:hypothetical protein